MISVSSWVKAATSSPFSRRWMPSSAILMQSTPSLTWRRISSTASALVVTSLPIDVSGAPNPSRVPVGQTLMRRHIASGRHDPRTVEQTGADRIADRQADLARVARRADRREADGGNLLGEEHPAQG